MLVLILLQHRAGHKENQISQLSLQFLKADVPIRMYLAYGQDNKRSEMLWDYLGNSESFFFSESSLFLNRLKHLCNPKSFRNVL